MDSAVESPNLALMNGQVESLPTLRESYSERLTGPSPGNKDGVRDTHRHIHTFWKPFLLLYSQFQSLLQVWQKDHFKRATIGNPYAIRSTIKFKMGTLPYSYPNLRTWNQIYKILYHFPICLLTLKYIPETAIKYGVFGFYIQLLDFWTFTL